MEQLQSWGLVGHGTIGQTLAEQLVYKEGVAIRHGLRNEPSFVIRTDGTYDYRGPGNTLRQTNVNNEFDDYFSQDKPIDIRPEVLFIALPSTIDGELAMGYIRPALQVGKLVITAEKGALANHFKELKALSGDFALLRHNATVGGGTGLIDSLREQCIDPQNVREIHLALNGTLSYIFSEVGPLSGRGTSLGEAVDRAMTLGYAEPGATDNLAVIRAEAEGDTPKKVSILFNRLGLSDEILQWQDLKFTLSDDAIEQAVAEATERRMISSIYSTRYLRKTALKDIVGINVKEHGPWTIVTGFVNTKRNPLYQPLAELVGPAAGFTIGVGPNNEDGTYRFDGPGAGPKPTTRRMLDDLLQARREHVIPEPSDFQQHLL